MNEEWEDTTLGEVATFVNGFPFKPEHLSGTKLPVIRIKQLLDERNEVDYTDLEVPQKNIIDDGDLIFSWSGTLASRFWTRGKAALNQHLFRVTANAGSDLGWVHLALDHAVDELMTKTHGTTMKHVTKKVLESHKVARPPLPVQRRIVDLMTHLDAHIANLQAERDRLSGLRRDLVHHLLTEVFADNEPRSLGEFCLFINGDRSSNYPKASERQTSGVAFVNAGHLDNREIDFDEMEYISESVFDRLSSGKYRQGDILFCLRGSVGKFASVQVEKAGAIASSLVIIRCLDELDPSFLMLYLDSAFCQAEVDRSLTGAVQPNLSVKSLSDFQIAIPTRCIQLDIVSVIAPLDDGISALSREVELLNAARQVLLAELMSGSTALLVEYDRFLREAA